MKLKVATFVLLAGFVGGVRAEPSLQELESRLADLTKEVQALKEDEKKDESTKVAYQPVYGLSPAASKVYHLKEGVSLGGYGEMVYQNYDGQKDDGTASGKKDTLDFLRFVLYAGYRFSEKFVLNSEIEFEHAAEDKRGEVSVEMVTLDYLWSSPLNVRGGLLLLPVGFVNENHEPTVYHGVLRPSVERNIIPSTWRENGAGIFGQVGPLSYKGYVINGLQAVGDLHEHGFNQHKILRQSKGFQASTGVRDGRQKGSSALAEDWGWVGRLDYQVVPGVAVGGSVYSGDSGQGAMVAGEELKAKTTLWETRGDIQWNGLELRGIYTRLSVNQAGLVNVAQGFSGNKSVGEKMWGGYGQLAYNVFSVCDTGVYLAPFVRYERYNTQHRVPGGYATNPANDRTELVYGLTFEPIATVVLKGEYQNNRNRADTGVDQWNFGMGYMF
ncbi:MAG: hypothetical protein IPN19_07255 [Elusimicrobia bacterium]|nr:hypothetical protein [Elusimicrobiota bacterium]